MSVRSDNGRIRSMAELRLDAERALSGPSPEREDKPDEGRGFGSELDSSARINTSQG